MKTNYGDCLREKCPKNGEDLYKFVEDNKIHLLSKKVQYRSISNKSKRDCNYKPVEIYDMFFEKNCYQKVVIM